MNKELDNKILWQPNNRQTVMGRYRRFIEKRTGLLLPDYQSLHAFSIEQADEFWISLFDFFQVKYSGSLDPACLDKSFKSYGWFPEVKLNFAQNLLMNGNDLDVALAFSHESGLERTLTYRELKSETARLQKHLENILHCGDVLAAFMPNIPHTVVAMLATTGLGATFTSTSCDFGIEGVIDRFGQSKPTVLVAATHYQYNGKLIDLRSRLEKIVSGLPSLKHVVLVDFLGQGQNAIEFSHVKTSWWEDIQKTNKQSPLIFKELSFHHPLYIMYSSGTTGKPKCIVHTSGGVLLQHLKEIGLHSNFEREKTLFFFTTCGWMMWNWLVSGLFFGGKLVLYEGSPTYPSMDEYLKIIDRWKINLFGTSPKFLRAMQDHDSKKKYHFPSLECVFSTGAPLLPEQFDYLSQHFSPDTQIASISGGTDIIGCFMLGNPDLPVRRGEIQCLGLGMDVAALGDQGERVKGKEGELVCGQSFPSRPLGFLNDPDSKKLQEAYFERFAGYWHHGDFVSITKHGGVVVFGRSDATLNPGGVRIGTSEIYRQIEGLPFLLDSLCVGRQSDGDVDVMLFLKLKEGEHLTQERIDSIKKKIREGTTPRHVPKVVAMVTDIPYTRSGKKMEMAVVRLIHGKELTNIEAVANPESLDQFKQYKL